VVILTVKLVSVVSGVDLVEILGRTVVTVLSLGLVVLAMVDVVAIWVIVVVGEILPCLHWVEGPSKKRFLVYWAVVGVLGLIAILSGTTLGLDWVMALVLRVINSAVLNGTMAASMFKLPPPVSKRSVTVRSLGMIKGRRR